MYFADDGVAGELSAEDSGDLRGTESIEPELLQELDSLVGPNFSMRSTLSALFLMIRVPAAFEFVKHFTTSKN